MSTEFGLSEAMSLYWLVGYSVCRSVGRLAVWLIGLLVVYPAGLQLPTHRKHRCFSLPTSIDTIFTGIVFPGS